MNEFQRLLFLIDEGHKNAGREEAVYLDDIMVDEDDNVIGEETVVSPKDEITVMYEVISEKLSVLMERVKNNQIDINKFNEVVGVDFSIVELEAILDDLEFVNNFGRF